jgi:RimJ/RimL family protein N-acetyltransferase
MKNLAKTYRIETKRLVLRCYQPSDAPLLKKSLDDSLPELLPWMHWTLFPEEYDLLDIKLMPLKAFDIFGMEIKKEG